jgi:hypothetical protein
VGQLTENARDDSTVGRRGDRVAIYPLGIHYGMAPCRVSRISDVVGYSAFMDLNNLTQKSQEAVQQGQTLAVNGVSFVAKPGD